MIQKVWDLDKITDRLLLQAIKNKRPLSCMLELTYRCNFRCKMCYIHMTDSQAAPFGRMRTVEEWLDMAGQLYKAGVLYLTLTGGECTAYPGFVRLYEELSKMGFFITVMSNAGGYNDTIRDVFRRFPPRHVSITLYGASNETYKAVTGDPSGYDKTLSNIEFFRSIGVPVNLNFTMIRQNVMDYPKIGKLCASFGIPFTMTSDITGHRYCAAFSDAFGCRLSPAQRACVAVNHPEDVALALNEAGSVVSEELELDTAKDNPEFDYCIGAFTGCAIAWNGDMNYCMSFMGNSNVKPFEIGFEAAWALLKERQEDTFRTPAKCLSCSMYSECPQNCAGRRFEGTGDPGTQDPYTCQYAKILKSLKNTRENAIIPDTPKCN